MVELLLSKLPTQLSAIKNNEHIYKGVNSVMIWVKLASCGS